MTDILEQHIAEQLMELSDTTTASRIIAHITEIRELLADLVAASLATNTNRVKIADADFRLHGTRSLACVNSSKSCVMTDSIEAAETAVNEAAQCSDGRHYRGH